MWIEKKKPTPAIAPGENVLANHILQKAGLPATRCSADIDMLRSLLRMKMNREVIIERKREEREGGEKKGKEEGEGGDL